MLFSFLPPAETSCPALNISEVEWPLTNNTEVDIPISRGHGSIITYECIGEYMLAGTVGGQGSANGELVCTSTGKWNLNVTLPCKREFLFSFVLVLMLVISFLFYGGVLRKWIWLALIFFIYMCISLTTNKQMSVCMCDLYFDCLECWGLHYD